MKSLLRRRPSPALVISLVALFISLSGVSYGVATGFIDSREIKNNEIRSLDLRNNEVRTRDLRNNEVRGLDIRNSTVQGRDVALNTLTGDDIRESGLGKVPSATAADSATTAATADAVPSLKQVIQTVPEGGAFATLATHGPFTVSATCSADGADTSLSVRVATTEAGSAADGPTNSFPLLGPADPPASVSLLTDLAAVVPRTLRQDQIAAWSPSGKALTGTLSLIADAAGAGSCTVHGQFALQG